jgi:dienelactone hydrolase
MAAVYVLVCGNIPEAQPPETFAMTLTRALLPLIAGLLLSACASSPERRGPPRASLPPPDKVEPGLQARALEIPRPGARPHEVGLRVVLTRRAGGRAPVVVYLPGLGEPAGAGQRWAEAWASAGYAVLSLQPLDADAFAYRSELARSGEFNALGELHFGAELRRQRLQALRAAVAQLQALPDAPWSELDWSRSAVAGFEIGAQAALDLALADSRDGWQPSAVIALSPLPDPAWRAAPRPVLLIGSELDADPLGLLSRSSDRRQVWQALRSPDAYELVLPRVPHAGLAGSRPPEVVAEQDLKRAEAHNGGGSGGGGRRGGGFEGGRPPGQVHAGGLRSGSPTEAARADLREAWRLSTAFLDMVLKDDAQARQRLLQGPEPGQGRWHTALTP